ncbi:MAG: FtsH protease activity modulator HflK [Anaerolineae bacterium]|nr:FtsH protease activity modulator HflK [Anaerolineae bacterium]
MEERPENASEEVQGSEGLPNADEVARRGQRPAGEHPSSGTPKGGSKRSSFAARSGSFAASLNGLFTWGWREVRQSLAGDGHSPLDDLRAAFGHLNPRRIGLILVGLALLLYLLSGLYTVRPGEVAVVRRFGQVITPRVTEGLHYRLPWPIEQETIINVSEVRRESIGLTEPEAEEHPLHLEAPGKLQVLSGDTNIVDYEVIVQYQISDPVAYLFNVDYPHYQLIRDAVRAAVTQVSGSTGVDAILTTERQTFQNTLRQQVQALLDESNSGLAVVGVSLQKAYPPDEVADAFRDVSSAREDKDKAINEAEGYANSIIPEARGEANRTLAEAAGYAKIQVDQATGAAESFKSILAEYQTNSKIYGEDVTRFRLYVETMEKILPRVQTYIVQRGERINLRLLNDGQVATFPPSPGGQ